MEFARNERQIVNSVNRHERPWRNKGRLTMLKKPQKKPNARCAKHKGSRGISKRIWSSNSEKLSIRSASSARLNVRRMSWNESKLKSTVNKIKQSRKLWRTNAQSEKLNVKIWRQNERSVKLL